MDIKYIEEIPEIEEYSNPNDEKYDDKEYWKSVLYALKANKKELEEIQSTMKDVVHCYSYAIERKKKVVDSLENHIKTFLTKSRFKTKDGGYKFNLYPHIGSITLGIEKDQIQIDDSSKAIDLAKRYSEKAIKIKHVIDAVGFKDCFVISDGKLVDKNTGEEIDLEKYGCSIVKKRRLIIS